MSICGGVLAVIISGLELEPDGTGEGIAVEAVGGLTALFRFRF